MFIQAEEVFQRMPVCRTALYTPVCRTTSTRIVDPCRLFYHTCPDFDLLSSGARGGFIFSTKGGGVFLWMFGIIAMHMYCTTTWLERTHCQNNVVTMSIPSCKSAVAATAGTACIYFWQSWQRCSLSQYHYGYNNYFYGATWNSSANLAETRMPQDTYDPQARNPG